MGMAKQRQGWLLSGRENSIGIGMRWEKPAATGSQEVFKGSLVTVGRVLVGDESVW